MSYVLFDIGGSKTRVAISEDLQTIVDSVRFDTPKKFSDGVRKITDEALKLAKDNHIRGIAGGIRGVLDDEKGCIVRDPGGHLSSWVYVVCSMTRKGVLCVTQEDICLVG